MKLLSSANFRNHYCDSFWVFEAIFKLLKHFIFFNIFLCFPTCQAKANYENVKELKKETNKTNIVFNKVLTKTFMTKLNEETEFPFYAVSLS